MEPVSPKTSTETLKRKLKKPRITPPDALNLFDGDGVCAAYCTQNPVRLTQAAESLKVRTFTARKKGIHIAFTCTQTMKFSTDVVHMHLQARASSDTPRQRPTEAGTETPHLHDGHAFFFTSGAVVFWGLPFDLRRQLFDSFAHFQEQCQPAVVQSSLQMRDFEHEFRYTVNSHLAQTTFRNDEILLVDLSDASQLLSLSYGLAQSVRLLVYEEVVDSLVARTRTLPDELAEHGHVKLSHRELKRLIGELLAARYSVNLVSDILDTPEYFWQHAEFERLHLECSREVELKQRARILDTRTEVIKDALALLNNELSASSSDRVERAILFLIAVEVAIEVTKALVPVAT